MTASSAAVTASFTHRFTVHCFRAKLGQGATQTVKCLSKPASCLLGRTYSRTYCNMATFHWSHLQSEGSGAVLQRTHVMATVISHISCLYACRSFYAERKHCLGACVTLLGGQSALCSLYTADAARGGAWEVRSVSSRKVIKYAGS